MSEFNAVTETKTVKPTSGDQFPEWFTKQILDCLKHPRVESEWTAVLAIVSQAVEEAERRGQPSQKELFINQYRKSATYWMKQLSEKLTKGRILVAFILGYEKVFLEIVELVQADALGKPPATLDVSPLEHQFRTKKDLGKGELMRLIYTLQGERDAMCDNWKITHKAYLQWDKELQILHGKDVHKALAAADKEVFGLIKQLEVAVIERDKHAIAAQQSQQAETGLRNQIADLRVAMAGDIKAYNEACAQVVSLREQATMAAASVGHIREECTGLMRQLLKAQNEERRLEHACKFYRERHDTLAEHLAKINKLWPIVFARKLRRWYEGFICGLSGFKKMPPDRPEEDV